MHFITPDERYAEESAALQSEVLLAEYLETLRKSTDTTDFSDALRRLHKQPMLYKRILDPILGQGWPYYIASEMCREMGGIALVGNGKKASRRNDYSRYATNRKGRSVIQSAVNSLCRRAAMNDSEKWVDSDSVFLR